MDVKLTAAGTRQDSGCTLDAIQWVHRRYRKLISAWGIRVGI